MTLTGFLYYYRDLLAYNAMYYYTYLVETIKPYYYTPEQITDGKMSLCYLSYKDTCYTLVNDNDNSVTSGFCVLKLPNNIEKYAPIVLNDLTDNFNEYRKTGNNTVIEKILNGRSEILTASVTITSDNDTLPPFDCTNLFHKFYFPGNKLVLTPDTRYTMIKLIEYEYGTKFPINYDNFNIQYIIITMNSKFYMSSNMIMAVTNENNISIINREETEEVVE